MEKIIAAIQNDEWEEALNLFMEYANCHELDDRLCLIGATILEQFDDREALFDMIRTGLKQNPANYELYLLLGNYYLVENKNKSFLAYENALYYARKSKNNDDASIIQDIISNCLEKNDIKVRKVSILVLSDEEKDYSELCEESIKDTCFEDYYEIKIIDVSDYENRVKTINTALENTNSDNDVLILSGDVVLTPNSLFYLRMALYEDDLVGMASAISNNAFYYQMPVGHKVETAEEAVNLAMGINVSALNPIEEKTIIDSNFVIIRRELIDKLLPLDNNVISDKYFAINLCLDSNQKGYKNVICWNAFVYHFDRAIVSARNQKYKIKDRVELKEKWGFSPEYYMTTRSELVDMIKRDKDEPISVLEVGAGLGSTLTYIKYKYPNAKVFGIEIVNTVVKFAAKNIVMKCDNIETYTFGEDEKYDYIIFGDVLEHLVDPYSLVERLKEHLNPGGCIIASIPNILNAGAIYEILHGGFEYKSSGILDSTHLRFFTKREIVRLFHTRGYEIVRMFGIYGAENSHAFGDFFDKLLTIEGIVDRAEFDMLQYAVCARLISK